MSNWNFGSSRTLNGGGETGLFDLKALLNQAIGGGLSSGLSSAVGSGPSGGSNHRGGSGGGLDTNTSANGSYFDPFSSMSSFGFFNPKDPGSNLPLPSSNSSSSSMGCMNNHLQGGGSGGGGGGGGGGHSMSMNDHRGLGGGNGSGTIGGHIGQGGHGHSKSPTYHHPAPNHHNSHSPVFGAPNSPTFFGSGNGMSNQHNNHYSSSSSYSSNKFPITTFSIDETLPGGGGGGNNGGGNGGGGGGQGRNNDSSIFGSDDISSNGNSHFNSNSHYNSNNHHGRNNERERERERDNYSNNHGNGNSHSSSRDNRDQADSSFNQGVRETGIIEKLLHSYGFIQCCERQARLFFHFSQFEGTIEHLKLGDPVEFEMTYDRRTGKPIASAVTKIGPEVVLSEERVTGTVTTELHHESNGELQGRISYENRGECFFLPYCQEDIEGNVSLCSGDTVSFQIATNQRSGNLTARYVRLENPAQPVRYKGIVSSIKDSFGFIERADVAKEIFFHFSETRVHEGIVVGDNVEFNIQTRNGKEVACSITKLPMGTVVFEDIGVEILKGQVLKPIDKTQPSPVTIGPTPRSETMQGRLRYRGPDRQELEVVYGEKDQKGSFTMRHGDWVEFSLAVDRRDKQQRATNITLLEESFVVSGERREEGVISNIKDGCGYITCAERDFKMYFRFNELLDFNRQPKIADDVEFTIIPDPASPVRQSGIRIKYLKPGTVQFEIPLSKGVKGVVVREPSTPWVSQEALAGLLPSLANLGLPPNVTERLIQGLSSAETLQQLTGPNSSGSDSPGEPGVIQYQVNEWQQETIIFHWKDCKNLRDIRVGTKITFDINQVRRTRELIAANIQHQHPEISENREDCFQELMQSTRMNSNMAQQRCSPVMVSQESLLQNKSVGLSRSPDSNSFCSPPAGISLAAGSLQNPTNSDSETPCPNESSSDGLDSPVDDMLEDVVNGDKSSLDESEKVTNGQGPKYHSYRSSSSSDTSVNEASNKSPRIVMKGFICTLKEGFGFIETITQDEEIFFHSSSLVGEFSALELGQEVEYVESGKPPVYGRTAADIVKPLPKGSIGRAAVFPEILHGVVTRPLRGANPDQTEYTGYIEGNDGHGYPYGIISMLNKKETLQSGEVVEFQLDAQGKPVNIRADRKKLRATVEAVKGQYGFLSYELDDGKKLFFHMSEVKDHQHLNPGDEVEFVILQNPRNGKSSACSVVKLGESQRPERLLNRVTKLSLDETAKRVVLDRHPFGPDGTRGFTYRRVPRTPGMLTGPNSTT